jgi:chromosome partitioning protein
MKTIVIAKTKGGVGGSMLCYNLALYAATEGTPVCLIDRDPQETLTKMWAARSELITPVLIDDVESVARSVKVLTSAKNYDRQFLFVDTPGSMIPIIVDAISAADLIVVPVQPNAVDLWGQEALLDLIEKSNLTYRTLFVLTRTSSTKWGIEEVEKAKKQLRKFSPYPIPMMPERIDYRRAAEKGRAPWEINKDRRDIKAEIADIWDASLKAMKKASNQTTGASNVIHLTR